MFDGWERRAIGVANAQKPAPDFLEALSRLGGAEQQLIELEQLADDGDTLEVVAKLRAIVREPKRETPTGSPVDLQRSEVSLRTEAPQTPSA